MKGNDKDEKPYKIHTIVLNKKVLKRFKNHCKGRRLYFSKVIEILLDVYLRGEVSDRVIQLVRKKAQISRRYGRGITKEEVERSENVRSEKK